MSVTIRDVAHASGVTPGTASRALRGHPQASEECIARVRDAAERLGYRPLRDRSKRSNSEPLAGKQIAVAMFGIDRTLAGLPVVAEAIHGAEEALAEAGAHPIIVNVPDPAEPPRSLRRVKFDGILAKAAMQGNVTRTFAQRLRHTLGETPLVWILGRPADAAGDVVDPDDALVGRLAAEAAVANGHRRAVIVNPKADHALFAIRSAAFRRCMEEHNGVVVERHQPRARTVSFPLQPVMDVAEVQPLVDEALELIKKGDRDQPTVIFCPADSIAALVYRALATRGRVAGRDISVVSCHNERSLVAGLWPTLATVDVHPQRIGRLAVEQLARRIAGQFAGAAVQISVAPNFIPGGSLTAVRPAKNPPRRTKRR